MKKCPDCQKTFDDNMKFCQTDGTPLVVVADNKPEVDPYATMVANKGDLQIPPEEPKAEVKKEPKEEPKEEPKLEADPYATMVASSPSLPNEDSDDEEDDLLDILNDKNDEEVDPMKTMIVSGNTADNIKIDIPEEEPKDKAVAPPVSEPPMDDASEAKTILSPDIPKFDEPSIAPPNLSEETPKPAAKNALPKTELPKVEPPNPAAPKAESPRKTPSSPFDSVKKEDSKPAPIPSPFDDSMPPGTAPPSMPPFEPPKEPLKPKPLNASDKKETAPKSPFADSAKPSAPPNQGSFNAPSSPPFGNADANKIQPSNANASAMASNSPAANEGQSQTLAIVSLVLGILSIPCCTWVIFSIAAIITGFMAKSKADQNPAEYGGRTFALVGIILGAVTLVLGIIVSALYLLGMFGNLIQL